ncbi:MAG: endolytic transglycosylase MltG [Myxococcota bacterium]
MRLLASLTAAIVLVAGASFGWLWSALDEELRSPLSARSTDRRVVSFEAASDPGPVWRRLVDAGVSRDGAVLRFFFQNWAEGARSFPAGEVAVSSSESILGQLERIAAGELVSYTVNLEPGLSTEEVGRRLEAAQVLDAAAFVQAARRHDAALLRGLEAESLDGFLLPDVYAFPHGESEERVLNQMVERFFAGLDPADWAAAAAEGLEASDWVRLAALLQTSEVPQDLWRLQAALLRNRRRRGFSLKSSPPALQAEGPLAVHGFEPGTGRWPSPAVNPGLAALRAAARPADSDSLYLVRLPNGEYVYSVDVDGFEEAMGIQRLRSRLPTP